MKIRFWGVRGSCATPGAEFLRYGGNTTAIEVRNSAGQRVLIDLGTGVTEFAKELMGQEFGRGQGTLPILLTHTHVDHIQGLPFFTPFFIRGNLIQIMGAQPEGTTLQAVLQDQLNGHYSPLYGLENLAAGVEIESIDPDGPIHVEGFEVRATQVPHGGTSAMAYRLSADGKSVVIMTDAEHSERGMSAEARRLCQDCDLLVHDAMFTDDEYELRAGWGHSSLSGALRAATTSGAKALALFHHSPDSRDEELDELVASVASSAPIPVFAAQEGREFDV